MDTWLAQFLQPFLLVTVLHTHSCVCLPLVFLHGFAVHYRNVQYFHFLVVISYDS